MSFPHAAARPIAIRVDQLLLFVIIVLVGTQIVGGLLGAVFLSGPPAEVSGGKRLMLQVLSVGVQTAIMFWALTRILMRPAGLGWADLGLIPLPHPGWKLKAVGYGLLCVPMASIINVLAQGIFGATENPQLQFLAPAGFSWINLLIMLVLTAVVAPVIEELVFRGFLYRYLRERFPLNGAMALSALIFACLHGIPILIPALIAVGFVLAWIYEKSGSIIAPIITHGVFNAVMTIILYVAIGSHAGLGG